MLLASCATVTIHPTPHQKLTAAPSHTQSLDFFFWGLVGEHHVDVKQICNDAKVIQMQSQRKFADNLLSFVTLGIYSPRTINVWCE